MNQLVLLLSLSLFWCPLDSSIAADTPSAGKQVEQKLETDHGPIPYLAYLPKKYDAKSDKKWPLVLFLHGRGESYGPLDLVTKWGPPKFAKRGDDLPFILVSPQCPADGHWKDETQQNRVRALLDHVTGEFHVDPDRVCLTGLSMGGYGSWRLSADQPHRFSCVVPICGGGQPEDANQLKSLPIWVFHGDKDRAVPIQRSIEMVEAIKKAGGKKILFTTLEHVDHNSWSSAYAMPQLYQWMLSQKRVAK